MKRLTIILVLLLFVFALSAQTNELIFKNFHVPPSIIEDVSYYDYMMGGYDGFPIQLQGESSFLETGIYFTYAYQSSAAAERKQQFAFAWRDPVPGGQVLHRQPVSNSTMREGFGTLQVDLANQSVIFVWHTAVSGTALWNVNFTWDAFSEAEYPGWGLYSPAVLRNNTTAEAIDKRHEYQWPVILLGPSPLPNHRRAYVFMSNAALSLQEATSGSPNPYYPSSSIMVSFADINNQTFAGIDPSDIVWTERYVPYLERLHNWAPINPKEIIDGTVYNYFARAFLGYAVAPAGAYAGHVALAGQIQGDTDEDWNDHDLHDHIILLATDYLENVDTAAGTDLPYGVFREYPFYLTRSEENMDYPMRFNPDEVAQLPQDVQDYIHNNMYNNSSNDFFYQPEWREQRMRPVMLNHKTLTFDRFGRLHIPSMGNSWWSTIRNEPGYGHTYTYSFTIQNLIFDLHNQDIKFANVYPKSYDANNEQFLSDVFLFPWDMNNDGWIDLHYDPVEEFIGHFTGMWPYNYHNEDDDVATDFHENQVRLSLENNGLIAMMWIDSIKAKQNVDNPTYYPDFLANPEIMIAISRDSGLHWSYPYALSVVSNPEIGTASGSLSYVYPADKVIKVDNETARVYFLYMDDNSWGTYTGGESPQGLHLGASIRYAAIDFDLSNLPVSEKDPVVPEPQRMLSQNFPNPFNPNTTIQFDIPENSDVKLSVYNVRGQLVNTLINENLLAGPHQITWNGTDNSNRAVSSGIYFYRIEANGQSETRRMVLMK